MNRWVAVATNLPPPFGERVSAIAADRRSGASALTRLAVEILIDAHGTGAGAVDAVACALCNAQPAMGSVWNAAAMSVGADGLPRVQRLDQQVRRAPRALARVFADLLLTRNESPGAVAGPLVVATVSASASVRVCLEALSERIELQVICAEARPLMEGRRLAADLAAAGISTTVCTDAGIGAVIAATGMRLEAVVVGADVVAPRWFVNKCGTRQVIEVAAGLGVPNYVVASRDKFVQGALADEIRPRDGPPEEVWEHPPRGVTVRNPYFERVPVELVANFVTDAGLLGPAAVEDLCRSVVSRSDSDRLAQMVRQARADGL